MTDPVNDLRQKACGIAATGDYFSQLLQQLSNPQYNDHLDDFNRRTALHRCAAASSDGVFVGTEQHTECAKLLIKKGADLNIKDSDGRLPLHLAVMAANESLVALILSVTDFPPEIDAADNYFWTPLMYAAKGNYMGSAKLLLKYKGKYQISNESKSAALVVAVQNGSEDVFKLLIKHGADPELANRSGESALDELKNVGWKSLEDWMNLYFKHQDEMGPKLLCKHSSRGNLVELAKLLLEYRLAVNLKYPLFSDRTSLLCAAAASKRHYAEGSEDHAKCIDVLIEHGASVNVKDSESDSALHLSVKSNNIAALKALLRDRSVDVDVLDKYGWTPLMLAASFDYADLVRELLNKGANPGIRNMQHRTAKTIAECNDCLVALEVLNQSPPPTDSAMKSDDKSCENCD